MSLQSKLIYRHHAALFSPRSLVPKPSKLSSSHTTTIVPHHVSPFSTAASETPIAPPARSEILDLYRSLLRSARLFTAYNFREYVQRRSKDAFRNSQSVQDAREIRRLYEFGKKELGVAERQGRLSQMYSGIDKLVIEKPGKA
ncbi:LYR motif-containing protein 4 [Chytridiales sp. JEL 0842]|nr:LYR motif-containing protein 4 [Chytridiales sp. JEL 0842]